MKTNRFDEIVLGRKSIRIYDEAVKISRGEILDMLDEAVTAPSSVNMQPWRFIVIDSQEGKQQLSPLLKTNQIQNETASAMVLIFGDLQCYRYGEKIYNKAVEKGKMSKEIRDSQLDRIIPFYQSLDRDTMTSIVKIDASLAAMQLMLVARAHGYDTNPIGGFEADQLAQTFGLEQERYVPVMILALGKAKEQGHESVRLKAEQITEFK
ncbi:nitroreductase family protein [Streptococcus dentasini]